MCSLMMSYNDTLNGKNWKTYWNGGRRQASSALDFNPSTHVPADKDEVQWELTNFYDGLAKTTDAGVPAYIIDPTSKKLVFSKLIEIGTKITLENILPVSNIHYYGLNLEEDSKVIMYWIPGTYIKRVGK